MSSKAVVPQWILHPATRVVSCPSNTLQNKSTQQMLYNNEIPVEEASKLLRIVLSNLHHPSSNVSILSHLNCKEQIKNFDQAQKREKTKTQYISCKSKDSQYLNECWIRKCSSLTYRTRIHMIKRNVRSITWITETKSSVIFPLRIELLGHDCGG